MADYYPLIARAVAGAEKNTAEGRRALYERARAALVGQLRSVQPPLSESDITRERLALEEAIRKVEADAVRQARVDATRAPPEPPAPPVPRAETPSRDIFTPPPEQPKPDPAADPDAPEISATEREREAGGSLLDNALRDFRAGVNAEDPSAYEPKPPAAPLRPWPRPPRNGDSPGADLRPEPRAPRDWHQPPSGDNGGPTSPLANTVTDAAPKVEMPSPARLDAALGRADMRPARPSDAAPGRSRTGIDDDLADLPPPPPPEPRRRPIGKIIAAVVVLVLLGVAGAVVYAQYGNIRSMFQTARAPSTPAVTPAKENGNAPPPKIPDRVTPAGADQNRASQPPVAQVAQRVVLYEEDPNDPQGKRLVGSAIWRTETVSPGANQPPELAVKADIEVPERRMGVTFSLRRNTDPALPASHTIEVVFKLPPDFAGGSVANVPGVLMKQSEQARGVPLAGVAVKVTNGYFLIALYSVDAEKERNIKLLKERAWFDIPIVYGNGRRAILAMEKGTPGERAFDEALTAWGQ